MAYEYRILPDKDLLLITGSGTVTSAEIHRVVTAFQRDPEWKPSMKMLVDWRRVEDLEIDHDDVEKLAAEALDPEKMKLGTPLGPRAAVVLSSHRHASVPMLYHTYLRASRLESKIFFNLAEAAVWLGVDLEADPSLEEDTHS